MSRRSKGEPSDTCFPFCGKLSVFFAHAKFCACIEGSVFIKKIKALKIVRNIKLGEQLSLKFTL